MQNKTLIAISKLTYHNGLCMACLHVSDNTKRERSHRQIMSYIVNESMMVFRIWYDKLALEDKYVLRKLGKAVP